MVPISKEARLKINLVTSIVTLITDADKSAGPDIGVTNNTTSVAFFTESTDCHTRLLPAKNQVWVVLCHHARKFSLKISWKTTFDDAPMLSLKN